MGGSGANRPRDLRSNHSQCDSAGELQCARRHWCNNAAAPLCSQSGLAPASLLSHSGCSVLLLLFPLRSCLSLALLPLPRAVSLIGSVFLCSLVSLLLCLVLFSSSPSLILSGRYRVHTNGAGITTSHYSPEQSLFPFILLRRGGSFHPDDLSCYLWFLCCFSSSYILLSCHGHTSSPTPPWRPLRPKHRLR